MFERGFGAAVALSGAAMLTVGMLPPATAPAVSAVPTATAGVATVALTAVDTNSVDLLETAAGNFHAAADALGAADMADGSVGVLSASTLERMIGLVERLADGMGDYGSVESAVLTYSGSLSDLVDEWLFEPYNQWWVDASAALLEASQALSEAIDADSATEVFGAGLDWLGVAFLEVIPAAAVGLPLSIVGDLFGLGDGAESGGAAAVESAAGGLDSVF